MQTRTIETPRPRPPAKVRRSLAKGPSTPPPAYVPTFPFTPGDGVTVLPTNTYSGWDPNSASPLPTDDLAWLDDKSRGELKDLLVKADALIKERETDLRLTSAACKTLCESNATLKSKHEVLLARLPLSPSLNADSVSILSPDISPLRPRSPRQHSRSLSRSTSESLTAASPSPEHTLFNSQSNRRATVSPMDFSFLADQNAELHSMFEKLQTESASADMVGRRELRRLEKEILVLKEELEKTQAKSDELEEKAKTGFGLGAEKIVEEALKRKKEREERISAVRKGTREGTAVKNFAPEGSLFGVSTSRSRPQLDSLLAEECPIPQKESAAIQDEKPFQQDQQLVAKLLEKIQELEATNTRILEQQTETSSRLQAVQRETEFMTKVYEQFSNSNDTGMTPDAEEAEASDQVSAELADEFVKSQHAVQFRLLAAKVQRQRSFHRREALTQVRPSIMGLFDDLHTNTDSSGLNNSGQLPVPFSDLPRHQPSYSIGNSELASPALSSLSFCSPPARFMEDLSSSVAAGPSLANELGDKWDDSFGIDRALPSPSPTSRQLTQAINGPNQNTGLLPNMQSIPTNSLQLTIEPPTPQKVLQVAQQEHMLIGNMSPRFRVAQTLRSRNIRWGDGRNPESLGRGVMHWKKYADDSSPTPSRVPPGGGLLVDAFEVMMEEFDERNGVNQNVSRSPSPETEQKSRENGEEGDEESREESPLTIRSKNEVTQSRFGSAMVEVWMWLQFFIIMLVFLWAMARRGPKSVLMNAERKRTVSMRSRA